MSDGCEAEQQAIQAIRDEIAFLEAELRRRQDRNRPLRVSAVRAYRFAIDRQYRRLDLIDSRLRQSNENERAG